VSIAVAGSLSIDRVAGRPPRIGGCPYYAARALRALGVRAVIVAKCAPPDRRLLSPALARLGLPVVWRDSSVTAGFSFSYAGEQRTMTVDAVADPWTPAEVAEPLRGIRWVHVAPLARTDFPPETLAVIARGRRLSLDGQGLVRPGRTGTLELDPDYDPDLLRSVSILKLSEEEASLLVDGLDERALRRLAVPEIVVTLGSRGCVVFADGVAELVRARQVESRDPTGAGDVFSAAYLAARSGGAAPTAAARRASALAADLLAGRLA
jgi:sugar/nucleoside kinase (ribokinase family)